MAFVDAFKAALGPLLLTVDAIASNLDGTWCSGNDGFLDLRKLGGSSIDRVRNLVSLTKPARVLASVYPASLKCISITSISLCRWSLETLLAGMVGPQAASAPTVDSTRAHCAPGRIGLYPYA